MKELLRKLFLNLFLSICATDPLQLVLYRLVCYLIDIDVCILLDLSNPVGQILDVTISTLGT